MEKKYYMDPDGSRSASISDVLAIVPTNLASLRHGTVTENLLGLLGEKFVLVDCFCKRAVLEGKDGLRTNSLQLREDNDEEAEDEGDTSGGVQGNEQALDHSRIDNGIMCQTQGGVSVRVRGLVVLSTNLAPGADIADRAKCAAASRFVGAAGARLRVVAHFAGPAKLDLMDLGSVYQDVAVTRQWVKPWTLANLVTHPDLGPTVLHMLPMDDLILRLRETSTSCLQVVDRTVVEAYAQDLLRGCQDLPRQSPLRNHYWLDENLVLGAQGVKPWLLFPETRTRYERYGWVPKGEESTHPNVHIRQPSPPPELQDFEVHFGDLLNTYVEEQGVFSSKLRQIGDVHTPEEKEYFSTIQGDSPQLENSAADLSYGAKFSLPESIGQIVGDETASLSTLLKSGPTPKLEVVNGNACGSNPVFVALLKNRGHTVKKILNRFRLHPEYVLPLCPNLESFQSQIAGSGRHMSNKWNLGFENVAGLLATYTPHLKYLDLEVSHDEGTFTNGFEALAEGCTVLETLILPYTPGPSSSASLSEIVSLRRLRFGHSYKPDNDMLFWENLTILGNLEHIVLPQLYNCDNSPLWLSKFVLLVSRATGGQPDKILVDWRRVLSESYPPGLGLDSCEPLDVIPLSWISNIRDLKIGKCSLSTFQELFDLRFSLRANTTLATAGAVHLTTLDLTGVNLEPRDEDKEGADDTFNYSATRRKPEAYAAFASSLVASSSQHLTKLTIRANDELLFLLGGLVNLESLTVILCLQEGSARGALFAVRTQWPRLREFSAYSPVQRSTQYCTDKGLPVKLIHCAPTRKTCPNLEHFTFQFETPSCYKAPFTCVASTRKWTAEYLEFAAKSSIFETATSKFPARKGWKVQRFIPLK